MSLTKGQLMTQYKNTRNELGTIRYSRLVKPNILDDYTLYLKDLTEIEELDKHKDILNEQNKVTKNIDLSKKTTLFELLDSKNNNSPSPDKSTDKDNKDYKDDKPDKPDKPDKDDKPDKPDKPDKDDKSDKDDKADKDDKPEKDDKSDKDDKPEKDDENGRRRIKITVSTNPDKKSNKLVI